MADSKLRRAGLDYRERARVREHHSLEGFFQSVSPSRVFALSTRGRRFFHAVSYRPGDALVFGPETRGLPEEILDRVGRERTLRLPMVPGNRSLNLSNAVAVTVFEAWRQLGYPGSDAAADAGPVYTV
jgi:tRNA (cytidine/uridine-2'-O-)-methyltransferase